MVTPSCEGHHISRIPPICGHLHMPKDARATQDAARLPKERWRLGPRLDAFSFQMFVRRHPLPRHITPLDVMASNLKSTMSDPSIPCIIMLASYRSLD